MDLIEHYNQLYTKSSQAILAGNYSLDCEINNPSDNRFGLTLLIRPDETVKPCIKLFLEKLKAIDPTQYYYPDSDIHITVMSIISCYSGFDYATIPIPSYIEIIQKSIFDSGEIKIAFKGVTASASAIMIQGFPSNESLNNLREKLRENFKKSTLEQSIDSRYTIAAAHSTVMRFQEKLQNPDQLIAVVEQYRDYDFGEFTVGNIEFVYNDWYQREKNTVLLRDFILK